MLLQDWPEAGEGPFLNHWLAAVSLSKPFTHILVGPVSSLSRILSLCFVKPSVIVNLSLLQICTSSVW